MPFAWILVYGGDFVHGVATTVGLIVAATLVGGGLSVLGAAARLSRVGWAAAAAGWYVELIRNTPFIVQLFFVYFGLPSLGVRMPALAAAVFAMTVNLTAYNMEILRAGILSVGAGQREAGMALGLRPRIVFLRVVMPQALRAVYPAMASQIVITMLDSAVVSQIAVRDLTYMGDLVQSRTFLAFQTYAVITVIYLGLSVLLRRTLGISGRLLLGPGLG